MNYFIIFAQILMFFYIGYVYFECNTGKYSVNAYACKLFFISVCILGVISMLPFLFPWIRILVFIQLIVSCFYLYARQEHFRMLMLRLISTMVVSGLLLYLITMLFSSIYVRSYDMENTSYLILLAFGLFWNRGEVNKGKFICNGLLLLLCFTTFILSFQASFYHKEAMLMLFMAISFGIMAMYRQSYCEAQRHENVLRIMTKRYAQKENNEKFQRIKVENESIMQQLHDLKKQLNILESTPDKDPSFSAFHKEVLTKAEALINDKKTGYALLDRILLTYQKRLIEYDVQINVEVDEGVLESFPAIDCCSIFCNLLDNAIESCMKCKERSIQLRVKKGRDGLVIIKMKNSCQAIKQHQEQLLTTKDNHVYHGYGMRNMMMIAQSYKGNLTYTFDEEHQIFTTILSLYQA